MLFSSAWETLETFGYGHRRLGAAAVMTAVLHTWGQTLGLHPHLHCIVPAGGLNVQGKWRHTKQQGRYLYPGEALSSVFRVKYVEKLRQWIKQENISVDKTLFKDLFRNSWVVDAREPFEKAKNVIEYLARYTHKVAISNHRLVSIDNGAIVCRYIDYRDGSQQKVMSLNATDFLERSCLHILPSGFVRIRHYGILSTRRKTQCLEDARLSLGAAAPQKQATDWKSIAFNRLGFDPDRCQFCGEGKMVLIEKFPPERGPSCLNF
ncbi:MAG: transposase [Bacteroidales bacterium]|nr:transposase [Bacteroidales bacterium]